ncbi:hypothetical protein WAF17_05450 [Bernardetia sp. ABR2-2B]|uniref:hypothetical protein n=1 Tax=Bernardetia sp. ABR2-2B TaxID=3127472 RepID=UPI0030CACF19
MKKITSLYLSSFLVILISCLSINFLLAQDNIKDNTKRELVIKGVYHGTNLYIQNSSTSDTEYCVKEIYVNNKVVKFPATTAFDINMSFLKINDEVVVKIIHTGSCTPKILNPQAIKDRLPFRFSSINVDMNTMIWVTRGEKKFGQFFIQIKNNRTWIVEKVISCKGSAQQNVYTLPLTHRGGENIYRIKYLDVTGKYYYSPEIKFVSEGEQQISFYPKSVTSRITFSRSTNYQILDNNGKLVLQGDGLTVDCSNLSLGAYYLLFEGQEERFFKK